MTETVVIAPFANERMREWPWRHYRKLVELLLRRERTVVHILGTRSHTSLANEIVRGFSAERVLNRCGALTWPQVEALIETATFVIANNSGIAHVAASKDCWTLCLFSASHSWLEWMPRGKKVVVVSKEPVCAPCEVGDQACPNARVCLTELMPEKVLEYFTQIYYAQDDRLRLMEMAGGEIL